MANARKGEYLLTLFPAGTNGDGRRLEFTARLTFNGLCDVLQALSVDVGDINDTLKAGFLNWVILREMFFASVKGQHGVLVVEDAGDLLERNPDRLLLIGSSMAGAFFALMPPDDTAKKLSKALSDDPAGNAPAPAPTAEDGATSNGSATDSLAPASGR